MSKVQLKRVYNATPKEIFEAWTIPSKMKKWLAPENLETVVAEVNDDGSYEIGMKGDEGVHTAVGEFKEKSKEKIVMSWAWQTPDGPGPETTLTINLKDLGDGKTELELIHDGFETDEGVKEHEKGWSTTLDKLEKFLK